MKIKITADSTCDLSSELLERHNISIIPLYVVKEGQALRDGIDLLPADLFRYVDNCKCLCTTAAAGVTDYEERFGRFVSMYDAVIHISLGSAFSYSYQNASTAANSYPNVYVIDSQNLSTGQGHLVMEAAMMAESGMNAEEIVGELEDLKERVEASFLLDRLDYMYKGGRCSLVSALGAKILHQHYCIEVKNGRLQVAKKYIGSFERCMDEYLHDRLSERAKINKNRVFITHTDANAGLVEIAKRKISSLMNFKEVYETKAGCVVSCHCGPGTIGVLFTVS